MKPLKSNRSGFTLIEVLVVMAIIAILVGITIGVAAAISDGSAEAKARAEMSQLQIELDLYKADDDGNEYPAMVTRGSFPTISSDLYEWFEEKYGEDRVYETTEVLGTGSGRYPVDPWGRAYIYVHNPSTPFIYTLGSLGPDGQWGDGNPNNATNFGNGDDITTRKGL